MSELTKEREAEIREYVGKATKERRCRTCLHRFDRPCRQLVPCWEPDISLSRLIDLLAALDTERAKIEKLEAERPTALMDAAIGEFNELNYGPEKIAALTAENERLKEDLKNAEEVRAFAVEHGSEAGEKALEMMVAGIERDGELRRLKIENDRLREAAEKLWNTINESWESGETFEPPGYPDNPYRKAPK